jgi:protein-S-isoprenylcysteine O-methyltransferase Ste14
VQLLEIRGKALMWSWNVRGSVHNVFPERGRVLTSGIFEWLRHPEYSAGTRRIFARRVIASLKFSGRTPADRAPAP